MGIVGMPNLPIHDLHLRGHRMTESVARYLAEAASVCLDRHHSPPTDFIILSANGESQVMIDWTPADAVVLASHMNDNDATRDGACACVIAAVEILTGLVVMSRARQGSGADYYIAPPGTEWDDLDDLTRLEVSGIDHGNQSALASRLAEKLRQLAKGSSDANGVAGVVLFSDRRIRVALWEHS